MHGLLPSLSEAGELFTYGWAYTVSSRSFGAFLAHRYDKPSGIAFVDATKIQVCNNLRIPRHKVFKGEANRGKISTGWFYGFKLHLIINDQGGIISVKVTPGNIDDRTPVPEMYEDLWGALYGDKGYVLARLQQELEEKDVTLITNVRKKMKPKMMKLWDKLMLRKRFVIETVFDQLKNISQIEHSRLCFESFVDAVNAYVQLRLISEATN